MAAKPDWLPQLLEEENFHKYHAYFDIFKHNHKAHSAIAYARMGASLERVKQHCHAQNTRFVYTTENSFWFFLKISSPGVL